METRSLPIQITTLAPDGSEIRELVQASGGSMVHCTLPAGATSLAVKHRTVQELWYVLGGRGQIWRRRGVQESVADVAPGVSLSIEVGTHFQFRNTGDDPLCIVITTMPPWPGDNEAMPVEGKW